MPYKVISIDQIPKNHPIKIFNKFWQKTNLENNIAKWEDFKPFDHPQILPWILLLTLKDDNYVYSICGTGCENIFQMSYQGLTFGEGLPKEAVEKRLEEFKKVREGEGPIFSQVRLPVKGREHISVYRGVFSFSEKNIANKIMVILAPIDKKIH